MSKMKRLIALAVTFFMVFNNLVAVPLSAEVYLPAYDYDAAVTEDEYDISEEYSYEEYDYEEDTEEDADEESEEDVEEDAKEEEDVAIYADVYLGVVAAISGELGLNAFNNGNSTQNPNLANHMNVGHSIIRMWTQVNGVNTPVPFDTVTATFPNGDCAMDYVVVNRMWVQGVGQTDNVNFIDVFKATAGTTNAWHWIDLVATYDGEEATIRLFNNYRVFGLHIFNNGPGGAPSTPNVSLATGGTIRMWTQIDGVNSLLPYSSLTVSALDQDGADAMQFIRVNRPWQTPNYINFVDANKNGAWQWIDLTVTHMDQTHTLRLVNSRFFSLHMFNNGPLGSPSTPNASLAAGGTIRIWTQLMGVNAQVPRAQVVSYMTATIRESGECALDLILLRPITGDLVGSIDVNKNAAWEFIDFSVTVFGQTIELELHNSRFFSLDMFNNGPLGSPSTPNADLATDGTIRIWTQLARTGAPVTRPTDENITATFRDSGECAMHLFTLHPGSSDVLATIDVNKNAPWEFIDFSITVYGQTIELELHNSRFFSLDMFNNGPLGSPSRPNASLANGGTIRIWTQLMGENAQVPRAQVASSMTATIQGSGECALDWILLRPITGDLVGSIDVNKNQPWEFIDFSVTVFGQTIELLLHNANYVPYVPVEGREITFNFPGMQNMIVQYWSGGTWHTLAGGPFDDYAEFSAPGATVVRAVRDGLVYSRNITPDGDYVIDAPVIQLYVRGVLVGGNTLGVVGGGFGSNWVANGVTAEVSPNENSFTVFNNRTYNVVLNRTGFFPLTRTSSEGDDNGYEYLYVDLSAYLVYIRVPAGVSNVRMQSNGWIVNAAQETDIIWLVVDYPNRDASVTFDFCCLVQHQVDFILDGHNPLYIECCVEQPLYTRTVEFRFNGGLRVGDDYVGPAFVTVEFGTDVDDEDVPELVREGYIFNGWYPANRLTNVTSDRFVTAQWSPIPQPYTRTVEFRFNGGLRVGDDYAGPVFVAVEFGTDVDDEDVPELVREGYIFNGWYPANRLTNVTSDRFVTAQWVAEDASCDCDDDCECVYCNCENCECVCDICEEGPCVCELSLRIINPVLGVNEAQDRVTVELIGTRFLVPYELNNFYVVITHAGGYAIINASDFVDDFGTLKPYYFSNTINSITATLIHNNVGIMQAQWTR